MAKTITATIDVKTGVVTVEVTGIKGLRPKGEGKAGRTIQDAFEKGLRVERRKRRPKEKGTRPRMEGARCFDEQSE